MEPLPRALYISVTFFKEDVNTKLGIVLSEDEPEPPPPGEEDNDNEDDNEQYGDDDNDDDSDVTGSKSSSSSSSDENSHDGNNSENGGRRHRDLGRQDKMDTLNGSKNNVGTSIGAGVGGIVRICDIKKDSILYRTPLRIGDAILAVNNIPCGNKRKIEIIRLLRSRSGRITIVVRNDDTNNCDTTLIESMVDKPLPTSMTGLTIRANDNNLLEIWSLKQDGLFADSLLAKGDLLLAINGLECRDFEPRSIRDIICKSPKRVSIMCQSPKSLASFIQENHDDLQELLAPINYENNNTQNNNNTYHNSNIQQQDYEYEYDDNDNMMNNNSQRRRMERRDVEQQRRVVVAAELPPETCYNNNHHHHHHHSIEQPQQPRYLEPVEVMKLPPDQYGQCHPIETPELIAYKLHEFDIQVQLIRDDNKRMLLVAQQRCPELLTSKFKLMFLRCEVYNAELAAKRYCLYWERRVMVFGNDDAFKPLTIQNCFKTEEHLRPFTKNAVSLNIVGGRLVRFIHPARIHEQNPPEKNDNTINAASRFAWYMNHASLENEEFQKKGLIMVSYMKGVTDIDREQTKKVELTVKGAIPIRLSAYHVLHAPRFISLIFAAIAPLIPAKLRKRFLFHNGSEEKVLDKLQSFGMPKHELPTYIGGDVECDLYKWYQQRLQDGK